jgi:gamma-glutamyltranspeptidase/glutathione hydrolase
LTGSAVASPHRLSAEAGRHILTQGGNAADAAVAVVAAQGVVAPETCGLGGDLFALVHQPGWDQPRALNASGRAGSRVDAGRLREAGAIEIGRDDPESVTIPGCVDGLVALIEKHGSKSLGDVLEPAITLAEEGFEVSSEQNRAFRMQADHYRDNPAVADFYPGGLAVEAGDAVSRPSLARTLRDLATGGRASFYGGTAGEDIVAAIHDIQPADLETNQAEWVEPIGVEVAGLTAWTPPPNSQGYLGPATLAVMSLLEAPTDPADPMWWHLMIEAYRCLAWERDDVVADPSHAPLPAHLLMDRDRLARAARTVERDRAGTWPKMDHLTDTAYMCVADVQGMAVSVIQSNYAGTGSFFGAARSGFLLQNRGSGFTLTPGHPNELAPGKRPLHTLAPTLWTEGDRSRWIIGTRGGAVQPQLVAQLAARAILDGSSLEAAQLAPRWTVSDFGPGSPPSVRLEPGVPAAIVDDLRSRGHAIEVMEGPQPGWGPMSIIELAGEERSSAPDPRVETTAALVF